MPMFDVTTTKRTRVTAANLGEAAELVAKIEAGDMRPPDGTTGGDITVTNVSLVQISFR